MSGKLTLSRHELIAKLETRIAEVQSEWDTSIKAGREEVARRETLTSDSEVMADYYADIAEGLRDGRYTLDGNGRPKGTPKRPGSGGRRRRPGDPVDPFGHYETEYIKQICSNMELQREEAVKPIRTSIELLQMATDDFVEIDASNYQELLAGKNAGMYGGRLVRPW